MRKPNFFIVGAPKCGTTALYSYLAEHPEVFMPKVKEPHFFSSDLREYFNVSDRDEYLRLFAPARASARAIGEASVWYLYSEEAAKGIRLFNPDSRAIVMVRHPISMFLSLHTQMIATTREDVVDAEQAWRLQADRQRGLSLPRYCEQPRLLLYGATCRLGEQVERLLSEFPRNRVLVVVFDDFQRDTAIEYRRTLDFLDLPDDHRLSFPRINAAHRLRWSRVGAWHRIVDRKLRTDRRWTVLRGAARPLGVATRALRRINVAPAERSRISPSFRRELMDYFAADIDKLGAAVGRNLSHWKLEKALE